MNNTNNNQGDDDAEALRQSFEAFMLTGKKSTADDKKEKGDDSSSLATTQSNKGKKKKKKKKQPLGSGGTPPKPPLSSTPAVKTSGGSAPTSSPSTAKQSSKEKKRYYQLVRSFNDKVQHTWLDLDDQMLAVLQNIVSIRARLPLEWKILHSSHLKDHDNQEPQDNNDGDDDDDWKHHGFLGKPKETPYSFHLLTSDVWMALSNDVMQHEKMLVGLRSLISNLAECHDALGRALDTLWKFHLDCSTVEREGEEEQDEEGDNMQHMVDCVTNVYQMLSMELYRKQCLVPLIIESTDDEILGIEKGKPVTDVGSGSNGLKAASKCSKSWKRGSEESCIDESLLMHVLKLGETALND